jgi:hypothetical protein
MPKTIERWFLFEYIGRELTPLSKPFKSKEQAEEARLKVPEKERKKIGFADSLPRIFALSYTEVASNPI